MRTGQLVMYGNRRAVIVENVEGWWLVRFADDTTDIIRPTHLTPLVENNGETPAGNRTLRTNVWGNLIGYVNGMFWNDFKDDNRRAIKWANVK